MSKVNQNHFALKYMKQIPKIANIKLQNLEKKDIKRLTDTSSCLAHVIRIPLQLKR